jgi:hypothetical protein
MNYWSIFSGTIDHDPIMDTVYPFMDHSVVGLEAVSRDWLHLSNPTKAGTFKNQFTMISWWYILIVVKVISPFEAHTAHRMATLISRKIPTGLPRHGTLRLHRIPRREAQDAHQGPKTWKTTKKTGDTKSAPNEQLTHWSMRFSWDSYYMFVNQWSNDQWFYPLVN